jgi:tetratricopeptide (TPR) repeat protein
LIKTKLITLEKRLLAELPGFCLKGRVLLMQPVGLTVCGLNFEGSQYNDTSFYVTKFVLPLCRPTDHLYFNFGDRIRHKGGGDRWNMDMPDLVNDLSTALREAALPFLSRGSTLEGFIEIAETGAQIGRNLEGLGYALARVGRTEQAVAVLNQLISTSNPSIVWQRELADQARNLRAKLLQDPEGAQECLANWEDETVRNLGLEEFRKAV